MTLHYVGGRYRFQPRPSLNRLIQHETERVGSDDVRGRVRERLEAVLGAAGSSRHVVLWPDGPGDVPDEPSAFQVAYLAPDWTPGATPLERFVTHGASGPRVCRNALSLVEPVGGRFDEARAAARRGLAVEALLAQGARIQLSEEQKAELKERLGAADQNLRSALAQAYDRVHVPTGLGADGSIAFAVRELATVLGAGRGLHERVREALGTHVADKVFPAKVAALAELGDEREWRWAHEVAHALPRFFEAPKVWTPAALRQGIAEAVSQGSLGYVAGAQASGHGLSVPSPSAVRLREQLDAGQIGLDEGCALLRVGLAERLRTPEAAAPVPPGPGPAPGPGLPPVGPPPVPPAAGEEVAGLSLTIRATEDDLFVLNQSLSKLRDLVRGGTMRLRIEVEARTGGEALDRVRARNAVIEPLEENPDVEVEVRWLGGGGA